MSLDVMTILTVIGILISAVGVWLAWHGRVQHPSPETATETQASTTSSDEEHPATATLHNEIHPPGEIDVEFVRIRYAFKSSHVPAEWRETSAIRAAVDMVSGITYWYRYTGDPSAVTLAVTEGGVLGKRFPPSETGLWAFNVDFPEQLRRGDTHTVTHVRHFRHDSTPPGPFMGWSPSHMIDRLDIEVVFDPLDLPINVRKIAGVPAATWPTSARSQEYVPLDTSGVVHAAFRNVQPKLGYGFVWEWR